MLDRTIHFTLNDAAATAGMATTMARNARVADVFLLNGPIGAGKTTFARAFIQARLTREEDVPSPTFTLVQTYEDDAGDIWHADLYRLTDPQEIVELGLTGAFDDAICLIEWPDLLSDLTPDGALHCTFAALSDHHSLRITGPDATLSRLLGTA